MAFFLTDRQEICQSVPPVSGELPEAPGWSSRPPQPPGSRRSPAPTTTSSAVTARSLRSFLSNPAQLSEFSSYLMGLDKSRRWPGPCPRLNSRYSKSCLRDAGLFGTSAGGCSDAAVPSGPAADGCAGSSAKKHHFLLSPRRLCLHKQETSLEQPPTAVAVEQRGLPHLATGPRPALPAWSWPAGEDALWGQRCPLARSCPTLPKRVDLRAGCCMASVMNFSLPR